jgi:putative oxidoreductase
MNIAHFLPLPESPDKAGWDALRLTLAILIAVHGWTRFLGGGVEPFGHWLDSQGLPSGFTIAACVTGIEIIGTVLLAARRVVFPLTLVYATIYIAGIVLVHAPEGWFVVGKGRNGVEFSILLVVALLCVGLQHVPSRAR